MVRPFLLFVALLRGLASDVGGQSVSLTTVCVGGAYPAAKPKTQPQTFPALLKPLVFCDQCRAPDWCG